MAKFIHIRDGSEPGTIVNINNIALIRPAADGIYKDVLLNLNDGDNAVKIRTTTAICMLKLAINNAVEDYIPYFKDEPQPKEK